MQMFGRLFVKTLLFPIKVMGPSLLPFCTLSKCSVTRQFGSAVSWYEFGFLYKCYVYVVFLCFSGWSLDVMQFMLSDSLLAGGGLGSLLSTTDYFQI